MACEHCDELNQTVEIRSPSELEQAIRVVAGNLADGTLLQAEPTAREIVIEQPPFAALATSETRPDFLRYAFRCAHCGQRFTLEAETYHGAGGRWQPQ